MIALANTPTCMYRFSVVANSAIGIGVPKIRRTHRHKSGFFVSAAWQAFMGGPCGASSEAPEPNPGTPTCTVPPTLIGVRRVESKNQIRTQAMTTRHILSLTPSKARVAYHRAIAMAALYADSSLSVRLKRYNAAMAKARSLEAQEATQ